MQEFDDGYFDWVYIDGNHHYDFVKEDLELSRTKVKEGGIIAGDDYWWGKHEGQPVKRAVEEFVTENGLRDRLEVVGSQYVIRQ